jgi:type II secretory pathway pseudopilin PulG
MLKKVFGFTLMEVMIMVIILGVMSAAGLMTYNSVMIKAEQRNVKLRLERMYAAIQVYMIKKGGYCAPGDFDRTYSGNEVGTLLGLSIPLPSSDYNVQIENWCNGWQAMITYKTEGHPDYWLLGINQNAMTGQAEYWCTGKCLIDGVPVI